MDGVAEPYPKIDHLRLLHDELGRREAEKRSELENLDRKATAVWATNGSYSHSY